MKRPRFHSWRMGLLALLPLGMACDPIDGLNEDFRRMHSDLPAPDTETTIGPEKGKQPTVVFLGDSLSAGMNLMPQFAYPSVLARNLAAEGAPFRLINAGMSGDTTAGGVQRLGWILDQSPDIVVVELGANDGLRGIPIEDMEANLRAIIERVKEHDVKVLLLGMRLPPGRGDEAYAKAFAETFPKVAKATGVPLVASWLRGVAGVPELTLPDGLHPNHEGHAILAENVGPALRELIEQTR